MEKILRDFECYMRIKHIIEGKRHLIQKLCENCFTCGAECWALKVEDERKLKTTEMRMLRMICGKTLKDKINNEKIREMIGVEKSEEFLREQRLRWLGHVEKTDEERGPG